MDQVTESAARSTANLSAAALEFPGPSRQRGPFSETPGVHNNFQSRYTLPVSSRNMQQVKTVVPEDAWGQENQQLDKLHNATWMAPAQKQRASAPHVWQQHGSFESATSASWQQHAAYQPPSARFPRNFLPPSAYQQSSRPYSLGHHKQQQARKTIYICEIHPEVTEGELAKYFQTCGRIEDCRLCSDSHSSLRFAFIQFAEEASVFRALRLNGQFVGQHRVRVSRSKTAMSPVDKRLLPTSEEEQEKCKRTVYAANIDPDIDEPDLRRYFEKFCGGEVLAVKMLHAKRGQIAFVEFSTAAHAAAALGLSGCLLGSLPLRVSPSKTPIRWETGTGDHAHNV